MDALLIVSPLSAWLVMLALSARAASEPGVSARSWLTDAPEVMTALCAFGLVMYPVALIQVWRAHVTLKVARGLL